VKSKTVHNFKKSNAMKRNHLFAYVSFAIILFLGFIIFSCQKEQLMKDNIVDPGDRVNEKTQLEKMIIEFRNKMDLAHLNPMLKSGEDPMGIDSAIWYIEALANLTYGNGSADLEDYVIDSSLIEVRLTNGQILFSDVQSAYSAVIDSLSSHNDAISANEKQLIVVDVSLKEADENNAIFEITSGFGTDNVLGFGNEYPWYWGWELGRCDSSAGVGKDAADIIYKLANKTITVPEGSYSYYTDVILEEVWYWEVPTNNNPYGDYLLFQDFQEVTLNHHCLPTAEIAYYINALDIIADEFKPTGKSLIKYFCWDETAFMLCGWNDCWDMCHVCELKYGIWHSSGNPPSPL